MDKTRNTYFIHGFDKPKEANSGASVGQFYEDWLEVKERPNREMICTPDWIYLSVKNRQT